MPASKAKKREQLIKYIIQNTVQGIISTKPVEICTQMYFIYRLRMHKRSTGNVQNVRRQQND